MFNTERQKPSFSNPGKKPVTEGKSSVSTGKDMRLANRKLLSWAFKEGPGDSKSSELSEEFKQKFGNSVLVDEDGLPLIFYHGAAEYQHSDEPFEKFDSKYITQMGFHFGSSAAAEGRFKGLLQAKENARIFPVVIRMENPLRLPDLGHWNVAGGGSRGERFFESGATTVVRYLVQAVSKRDGSDPFSLKKEIDKKLKDSDDPQKTLVELIKNYGFDGIIYRNDYESKWSVLNPNPFKREFADSVIVFDPHHVFSAINGEDLWKE